MCCRVGRRGQSGADAASGAGCGARVCAAAGAGRWCGEGGVPDGYTARRAVRPSRAAGPARFPGPAGRRRGRGGSGAGGAGAVPRAPPSGADPPTAAWLADLGLAPLAPDTEGVGLALRDGSFARRAGGPVRGKGGSGGGRYAGAYLPQPRLQVGIDPAVGDGPVLRGLSAAGGHGVPSAGQLGGPGSLVVRVDGRCRVRVSDQAVAPVALPRSCDVRRQDLVRRDPDVLPRGGAGVPAVRRGHRYVAEQLVPRGELVAGLALVGADGAGVESADVGEQGGDFAAVHGYSPVGSSRAASKAAVWASARVMPPGWAVPLPGRA